MLVGMKSDLRDEFEQRADELKAKGMSPIATDKANQVVKKIGAAAYVECSALKQFHLKEVFNTAIGLVLHPPAAAAANTSAGGCCEVA
jgi:Ras-related C3 botulinum toxin substrate 1